MRSTAKFYSRILLLFRRRWRHSITLVCADGKHLRELHVRVPSSTRGGVVHYKRSSRRSPALIAAINSRCGQSEYSREFSAIASSFGKRLGALWDRAGGVSRQLSSSGSADVMAVFRPRHHRVLARDPFRHILRRPRARTVHHLLVRHRALVLFPAAILFVCAQP